MTSILPNEQPAPEVKKDPITTQNRFLGSVVKEFSDVIFEQTALTLWVGNIDAHSKSQRVKALMTALVSIKARDEMEGMLAGQMVGLYNASMECLRRGMIPTLSPETRKQNLDQAAKLTSTYMKLMDGLQRYRGKGQQKVTVEHVHVHPGGQAIVGNVATRGGGSAKI